MAANVVLFWLAFAVSATGFTLAMVLLLDGFGPDHLGGDQPDESP